MKNRLPLLSLLIISMTFSCKKENVTEDTQVPVQLTLLTKVSGLTSLGANAAPTSVNKEFTYDNSQRLVKIKDGKKTTSLSYNYDILSRMEISDSTGSVVKLQMLSTRVAIAPSNITEAEELFYEGDKLVSKSINRYSYINNLISEAQISVDGGVQQVKNFNYSGNNITLFNDGKGNIYNYRYTDKLNPYANKSLKHLTGETDFTSTNLVSEIDYGPAGAKTVIKLVYTYNANGYPLTAKGTDANGNVVLDYTFEYRTVSLGTY